MRSAMTNRAPSVSASTIGTDGRVSGCSGDLVKRIALARQCDLPDPPQPRPFHAGQD